MRLVITLWLYTLTPQMLVPMPSIAAVVSRRLPPRTFAEIAAQTYRALCADYRIAASEAFGPEEPRHFGQPATDDELAMQELIKQRRIEHGLPPESQLR